MVEVCQFANVTSCTKVYSARYVLLINSIRFQISEQTTRRKNIPKEEVGVSHSTAVSSMINALEHVPPKLDQPSNLRYVLGSKVKAEGRRCAQGNEEKCEESEGQWDMYEVDG